MKEVPKKWGKELIVVNSPSYAGKVLLLDKNACSSIHGHKEKTETFFCIEGKVLLVVEDKAYWLEPWSEPVTINPGERHMFVGLEDSKIVEFSTEDKADDTFRLTESKAKNTHP